MVIPTYLQDRQKRSISKYHRMHQKMSNQCSLIRRGFLSKVSYFHDSKSTDFTELDKSTLEFVLKYDVPYEEIEEEKKIESTESINQLPVDSRDIFSREALNWKRGRFYGQIKTITVEGGVIVGKTYSTPKGNDISVLRNELGAFVLFIDFFFHCKHQIPFDMSNLIPISL